MKTNTKTPPARPILMMIVNELAVYWFGTKDSTGTSEIQPDQDGQLYYMVNGKAEYLPKSLQLI